MSSFDLSLYRDESRGQLENDVITTHLAKRSLNCASTTGFVAAAHYAPARVVVEDLHFDHLMCKAYVFYSK